MLLAVMLVIALGLGGLPLFAVLAAIGLIGLHHGGSPLSGGVADVYRLAGPQAVSLSTIPLFTFAGYLMASARTAQRLIRMAEALLGWVPGGLAGVAGLACAFFTPFTRGPGGALVAGGGG